MATKLTLILSGRTLQRHEFKEFDRIRIGRNEDCEVTIDNLGISRYHCEILKRPGFIQLRDLGSGNGTFVNGNKVDGHHLNTGDLISLGKFTIKYENDDSPEIEEEPGPSSVPSSRDGAMTLAMDAASLAKKHRAAMSRNRGYVTVDGRDYVLDKSLFTFGKESDADVQLTGWFCPRVAAILIRDDTGFRLVDVSPKGKSVWVNGIHKRDTWLNDNDMVVIRGKKITFHRGLPVGRS